jgi:hypothetical protein
MSRTAVAILVVTVLLLLLLFRAQLLRLVRFAVRHSPPIFGKYVEKRANRLNWPSIRRANRESLTTRIHELRLQKRPTFTIVGSIYLDITIRPVPGVALAQTEFGDLEAPELDLGGSARWVGNYLFEDHQIQSSLFSHLGAESSPFTRIVQQKLDKEKWVEHKLVPLGAADSGVSVHLEQADGSFRTTFTHRGALNQLGWDGSLAHVSKSIGRRGIL